MRQLGSEKEGHLAVGLASAAAVVALILCSGWVFVIGSARRRKLVDTKSSSNKTIFEGSDVTELVSDEMEDTNGQDPATQDGKHDVVTEYLQDTREKMSRANVTSPLAVLSTGNIVVESPPRCEIILLRQTSGTAAHPRSPKSVVSALTAVEEEEPIKDLEWGKSSQEALGGDEAETSSFHDISNMYTLIAKLLTQNQQTPESESDKSKTDDEIFSRCSAMAESLSETNSWNDQDHRRRHHPPSTLVMEHDSEIAWTEFVRQSSGESRAGAGASRDEFDDEDEISLREYMRRRYGALSTNAQVSSERGKVEI